MSGAQHTVTIRGESSEFKANIDSDIAALKAMGETINTTNRQAVNAWREEVSAQREVMQQMGATTAQVNALNQAVAGTERTIRSAENQFAHSTTQIGRGLFMVAGQGEIMGRGLITSISGASMMFGGPWLTAVAVAGLALTRFIEKSDNDFKTFEETIKRVSSEIAHLMPAEMEDRANRFRATLRQLNDEEARRQASQSTDPLMDPLGAIRNMLRLRDIDKERVAIQKELVTIERDEIPAKQRALEEAAFHLTLTREQQAVLRDTQALEEARDRGLLGRSLAIEQRLGVERGELARTRADIIRMFPDEGLTAEAANKFGDLFRTFDEQLAAHIQEGADKHATALEETWGKSLTKALESLGPSLEGKQPAGVLQRLVDQVFGPGPGQDLSGRMGPGMTDRLRVLVEEELRKGAKERAKLTPDSNRPIVAPADTLAHEFDSTRGLAGAANQIGGTLGKGFADVKGGFVDSMKIMKDQLKEFVTVGQLAAATLETAFDSAMRQIVVGHRVSMKELKKLAVEPIVTELEGLAKLAFARAAIDAASGDFAGAALMAAAAGAALAAAAEVSSLGGSGGGGSGGGGGGGSLTGSSVHGAAVGTQGIGALAGQRAGQGAMTLEVIITQKSPDGRTLQRERQLLQRLDDRQVPVRMTLG